MNKFARFLIALALCLPGLTTAEENESPWEPVEDQIGQWVLRGVHGDITAMMKNTGLLFIFAYHCPLGSVNKQAMIIWYAGDTYSSHAHDCNGTLGIEDVSAHNTASLYYSLPILARIHYRETMVARGQQRHN